RYSTMCNAYGGVVDDITVYKFHDEHFMIVTSSDPRQKTTRWIADHAIGTSTYTTDIGGAIALPVVQGPRSREFLQTVIQESDVDLNRLAFFRFTPARINDINVILSRSGYTGELGYELYTPAEDVGLLWDYLLQTGREFGLQPYGVGAMQSLRLEKALVLYGNDVNENYTPFHVGLDRWIRFDKREFIGREALLRVQERGLDERWVGLVLESPVPASYQDKIYSVGDVATFKEKMFSGSEAQSYRRSVTSGSEVGYITFSSRGHSVGKTLAVAYVATQFSWPGCNLLVDINGRLTPAKVANTPFFDPQGARMRAKAKDDGVQAQSTAVPKAPKVPADTPPRPPEEDAPPADKSDEAPPNKPARTSKKKSDNDAEAE
ncbi:MAG: hypothetical protein KDJ65_18920, partial [Anaerolineae bacterium]|nr:hypothetical protein [Anaerolineae bacterium]